MNLVFHVIILGKIVMGITMETLSALTGTALVFFWVQEGIT